MCGVTASHVLCLLSHVTSASQPEELLEFLPRSAGSSGLAAGPVLWRVGHVTHSSQSEHWSGDVTTRVPRGRGSGSQTGIGGFVDLNLGFGVL